MVYAHAFAVIIGNTGFYSSAAARYNINIMHLPGRDLLMTWPSIEVIGFRKCHHRTSRVYRLYVVHVIFVYFEYTFITLWIDVFTRVYLWTISRSSPRVSKIQSRVEGRRPQYFGSSDLEQKSKSLNCNRATTWYLHPRASVPDAFTARPVPMRMCARVSHSNTGWLFERVDRRCFSRRRTYYYLQVFWSVREKFRLMHYHTQS